MKNKHKIFRYGRRETDTQHIDMERERTDRRRDRERTNRETERGQTVRQREMEREK